MDLEVMKAVIQRRMLLHSDFIIRAETAERYYRGENDVLLHDPKDDLNSEAEENPLRNADNRIPRNFHGLLVDQKATYAFTNPPSFDVGNQQLNQLIQSALGDNYTRNCMKLCINAANDSVGWVHYWMSDDGFKWGIVDSKQIYPIYDSALEPVLLGVVRAYKQLDEDDGQTYIIYEYWNDQYVQSFRRLSSDLELDTLEYYSMFADPQTGDSVDYYAHGFGDVPFIPFYNNLEHTGDLDKIKKLIDVYDKVYSGFINDIEDVQEIIFVLTGYGGTDLNQFLQDLKRYKVVNMDDDSSGLQTLNIEIPIEARNAILDTTRKAIFEQGMGFDPRPETFGNQSGVALRFMYGLLDMKVDFMKAEFSVGFNQLVRAILNAAGRNSPALIIHQIWKASGIRNDVEQAQICKESVGILSDETIVSNHPFVTDPASELKKIEEQKKKNMEQFGFNLPQAGENEDPESEGKDESEDQQGDK